jgi:hypothetical protein
MRRNGSERGSRLRWATSRPVGRVVAALALVALVGLPALALRLACVGRACDQRTTGDSRTPFCDLPVTVREALRLGFRDGRSPDVLAVTGGTPVVGGTGLGNAPFTWPSVSPEAASRTVPLVFSGTGVASAASIPPGTGLEDVAPTIAEIIGLRRPHPEVRSGQAIAGVATGDQRPRLVLEVVLKGIGTRDLRDAPTAWPYLRSLARRGASTLEAQIPSLPLDPAAAVTTLGTGGLPSEHGMTGTFVRNDDGAVVPAWGRDSPFAVIATLGDHLDELFEERPRIGLVGTAVPDRGLIGGNWFIDTDRDDVILGSARSDSQVSAALELLRTGYGRDGTADLLAVVLHDSMGRMDRALRRLVEAAFEAADGSAAVVVTATGSAWKPAGRPVSSEEVEARVEREVGSPVVEAITLGGMFLDQQLLAESGTTEDPVLRALREMKAPGGGPLMADVFSGTAVTFAEYC